MNKWDFLQVLYVHQCSLLLNWFSKVWNILLPAFNICPYFSFFDCNWKYPGSDSRWKFPIFLWLYDQIVLIASFTKEHGYLITHREFIGQWMRLLNWKSLAMKNFKLILQINIHRKQNLNPTLGPHFRNPFLWIMCIESGNENGSTMSHTENLNYLEISKPNIQDGYLTCALQTNI